MNAQQFLSKAISMAADYHARQVDKGGQPYILHPLRVMDAVRRDGFSVPYQALAVLHDVVEDTGATFADFSWLGKPLCAGLVAITKSYEDNKEGLILDEYGAKIPGPNRETHAEYFARCVQDPYARVVKYYDTLDNMDPRRFNAKTPIGRYAKALTWYQENGVVAPPVNPL